MAQSPLDELIKDIKIHDVPHDGMYSLRDGMVYFEHGGRYYFANREDGALPKDPEKWSVIARTSIFGFAQPDRFHYYYGTSGASGEKKPLHTEDEFDQINSLSRSMEV